MGLSRNVAQERTGRPSTKTLILLAFLIRPATRCVPVLCPAGKPASFPANEARPGAAITLTCGWIMWRLPPTRSSQGIASGCPDRHQASMLEPLSGSAAVLLGKTVRRVESKPQRSDVRAQRIVGNNRLLDQIRTLPFLPPRFIAPERPVPHLSLPTPDRRRYQSANFNGCHLAAQWRSNVVWLGAAYAQACGAGCSSQDRNLRAMRGVYQNCTDWKCENETILLQPRPPRRS